MAISREGFSIAIDVAELTNRLDILRGCFLDKTKLFERIIIDLQRYVYLNWGSGWASLAPLTLIARKGQAPLSDKGLLKQTVGGITPDVLKPNEMSYNSAFPDYGLFGSRLIQAALMNYGGVVKPKRAKNLAIPVTKEAKESKNPRNFPRALFFIPMRNVLGTSSSTGWLAEKTQRKYGKGVKEIVRYQYLLKRQVVIPARKFIPTTQEAEDIGTSAADFYLAEQLAINMKGN